jgi:quinol monooxygenase YgiN
MSDSMQVSATVPYGYVKRIVLLVRFDTKPDQLNAFIGSLRQVVDIMRKETSFIDAVISQCVDRPNELLMYETWCGDRESWLRDEPPTPFCAEYEQALADLVLSCEVKWFTPLTSWYFSLPEAGPAPKSQPR